MANQATIENTEALRELTAILKEIVDSGTVEEPLGEGYQPDIP